MKHAAIVAATGGDLMLPFRRCLLVLSLLFIVLVTMTSAFARSASEQAEDSPGRPRLEGRGYCRSSPSSPCGTSRSTTLDYSQYRMIQFHIKRLSWRLTIPVFHPNARAGISYHDLIDINVVENGKSYPLRVKEKSFRVPDTGMTSAAGSWQVCGYAFALSTQHGRPCR